jgi:glycosyltransferase involved in cell wall biosynthesis
MTGNNKANLTVLHLTPFFSPNIGGVETYLSDLTNLLAQNSINNLVLTYSPITSNFTAPFKVSSSNLSIIRLPHFGHNLFHRLEAHPLLNFLYLTPYLGFSTLIYLLLNSKKINIIHAHGLNSAVIGLIAKLIFNKPLLVNLYSNYDNVPFNSFFYKLIRFTLNHCDLVLTQSRLSISQLENIGIKKTILGTYQHWIDLTTFKPTSHKHLLRVKQKLNPTATTFLFVGRLIPTKGALILAKIATHFPQAQFLFVGSGPQYFQISKIAKKYNHIHLFPNVAYSKLSKYYQLADYFLFPSLYSEGWGRVAMEAVASGLPVIGSNLGAITENLNSNVSVLFKPTAVNFKKIINSVLTNPKKFQKLKQNCRPYALAHFSSRNSSGIIATYQHLLHPLV